MVVSCGRAMGDHRFGTISARPRKSHLHYLWRRGRYRTAVLVRHLDDSGRDRSERCGQHVVLVVSLLFFDFTMTVIMEITIIGIIIKRYGCSPRTGNERFGDLDDVEQPELPGGPYSSGHLSRMSG